MMVNYYISRVYTYQGYRICVAGTRRSYRYILACPNGKVFVRGNFAQVIQASRSALQEAILMSIRSLKENPN